ncbi:MAG: hypothetical protein LBI04_05270 [Treponema sp.]|jgi:hypothetical protein|nr:hypothetical protein [Treponema sp.]
MLIEQIIDIQSNRHLELALPFELPVGRARMELNITPETRNSIAKKESAFGCLHHFADPSKIHGEKGAWERAVVEKYEKN